MKKYLLLILILLIPTGAWGTTWYACAGTRNISAANTWEDAAGCDGNVLTWNNQANGDIFEANAQTGLVVDVDPRGTTLSGTDKVHLKTLNGGGFTYNVNTQAAITMNTDITAGTSTALLISGAGSSGTELTIVGNIIGGSATNKFGISDSHTGAGAVVVVQGNTTSGSDIAGHGIVGSGATGSISVTGTATGGPGYGIYLTAAGTATVVNCAAGSTGMTQYGCAAVSTGVITVTGNIINSARTVGATGTIIWAPASAKNYIKFDGGGTAIYASAYLASAADGTKITPANTAVEITTGTYFLKSDDFNGTDLTQGTAEAGASGGGAFAW